MTKTQPYPISASARTRWILEHRGPKVPMDAGRPAHALWEEEIGDDGNLIPTATLFLTNRECPYRCLMCDLWRHTLDTRVPPGAIASQIRQALASLPPARQVKLYNSGSFFDPQAIPPEDYAEIAQAVRSVERVIVECHPRLIGSRTRAFRAMLAGQLEVAVGLETVHPETLERLNKQMTLADFETAARWLRREQIDLRVFLLLRPPFQTEEEGSFWAQRSLEAAFAAGATACCLIPTRAGNGALEALAASGEYSPPNLVSLEAAQEFGLQLGSGRVFADLWDIERFFRCDCSSARAARLETMNRTQSVPPPVDCGFCHPT